MSIAVPARKRVLFKIALSIATVLSLFFSVASAPSPPDWNKLSDQQIARLLFPEEKLYFEPTLEGLPMLDPASLDGVNVYEVKRVVANFDNDPENEMAVLIHYSTGMCTFCVGNVIFAILDKRAGKVRIAWKTEEGEAFDASGAKISTMKLIRKDKFFYLALIFDTVPLGTGSSSKKMSVIRWDGNKYIQIWSYTLQSYDSGGRGGIPSDYLARVDLTDDEKGFKRIQVSAIYTTRPHDGEERVQFTLEEEFVWSEKAQIYQSVKRSEVKYEKGETCVTRIGYGQKDEKHCYPPLEQRLFDQAMASMQKGDYENAISNFSEVLKINPKSTNAYHLRGYTYLQKGQYDQAIADYTKALEIEPRFGAASEAYSHRAQAYERKGQYDESIADYTRAAEIFPNLPTYYISRGEIYYKKGEYDRAISDYTKALEMKLLPARVYYARGLAYWKIGQHDQAISDLTSALGTPDVPTDVYYYRGLLYMDKGEYDKATADFNKALEINPKNTEVYFYKARAYERAGRRKEAVKTYKAFIQNVPSNLGPLIEQAAKRLAELQK